MKKIQFYILTKSIGLYLNIMSYIRPEYALDLSYTLFSHPRKGKGRLNPKQLPKTLQSAALVKQEFDAHEFYSYIWEGTEDTILLVHGWESNASRWKKLIAHLKKTGKTIIAIDAPGHGLSNSKEFNVPTYAKFIEHMVSKYNPSTVIGHSIGGTALAYFQHKFEHDITKMILIGAPSDFELILNNYFRMLSINTKIQKAFKKKVKDKFNIVTSEYNASLFLESTTINGIVAHDKDDDVVLFSEAIKLSNAWKNSQLISTEGFGHSMHNETLYKTISAFIEK
ncbi:MAG: hypothetical protein RLZZ231_512 [Bacteroidota bacterium]